MIAPILVLLTLTAGAQSGYKGLEPGRSTRADTERVLGAPVAPPAGSIAEFRSANAGEKIFVTFSDAGGVERIVLVYAANVDRAGARAAAGVSGTPRSAVNDRGRYEEFFDSASVVFTFAGGDAASGVNRIAFLDKGYYAIASAKATQTGTPTPPDVRDDDRPVRDRPVKDVPIRDEPGVVIREAQGDRAPSAPERGSHAPRFQIDDTLGRTLSGVYVSEDGEWPAEISVTWQNGTLRAAVPGWPVVDLVTMQRSTMQSPGDPVTHIWTFALNGNDKFVVQMDVSSGRAHPQRLTLIDDRDGRMQGFSLEKRER